MREAYGERTRGEVMARREWAEQWAFDASEGDTAQIRMTVAAKRLQAEHARAVRIVKRLQQEAEKAGRLTEYNVLADVLAALTKGRA